MAWVLSVGGACLGQGPAASQSAAPDRSDASIVLEIQRLLDPDPTIVDADEQRKALVEGLRQIPGLVASLEKDFPASRYRAVAYSLALNALVLRREAGDKTATDGQMLAAARRLLSAAEKADLRAQARFTLLQLDLEKVLAAATSRPARAGATSAATATTASAPAAAQAGRLNALAGKFIRLAEELPKTPYAPAALFQAGAIYLQAERPPSAIATFDRLARRYPKDPYSLRALMILVRLHTRAGRAAQALAAKRRCVEAFSDSPAAMKYRADIARAECIGKPFFLRFRSVRGRRINARDYKGKTVLVYFYISVVDARLGRAVTQDMSALGKLAADRGAVLLAVGADRQDQAAKVAAILNAAKIDTPNLLDPDGKVAGNYGVLFVPSVAVVGPDGKLADIISEADIVPAVRKALKPTATPSGSAPPKKPR